jgi:hypothetical protein
MHWHEYRLTGAHDDRWSWQLHMCKWRAGACLLSSRKPKTMDAIDVEL